MEFIGNFIHSFPAWIAPAAIAVVLGLAALVVYILGAAQGYTHEDYSRYRAQRRKKRRRR